MLSQQPNHLLLVEIPSDAVFLVKAWGHDLKWEEDLVFTRSS